MKFTKVYIIYNPKSSGDSETMAKELKIKLERNAPNIDCACIPTKHAGHARELACRIAKKEKSPLIISSSGDGGYNEVVNGVMEAGNPNSVCAVLPAGNANDHSRTMQDKPLYKLISEGATTKVDLIKITIDTINNKKTVRYAHSYAGLGLTPVVAAELNQHDLNPLREALIAAKSFVKYRSLKIKHDGKIIKLDSLLFGNINQMAKFLTLAPQNRPADGKFEIISFPAGPKWRLGKRLVKAAVSNLDNVRRAEKYEFSVIKKMPMQIDGEVATLAASSKVRIESAPKALLTVI